MACLLCRTGLGLIVAGTIVFGAAASLDARGADDQDSSEPEPVDSYVLGYEMPLIDGTPQDLSAYKGKVVLIVNTASMCGLTPQYKDLQTLHEARKDDGLAILGFPANNFMGQEPGSNKQIADFCEQNYGVTFPMFAKVSVKGDNITPLYAQLIAQPSPIGGEIQWNFDKFLVDRSGHVVARFSPRTKVTDEAFQTKVTELLGRDG